LVIAFFFSGRFHVISITPFSTLTLRCSVIQDSLELGEALAVLRGIQQAP
jgi:hypothetical protein